MHRQSLVSTVEQLFKKTFEGRGWEKNNVICVIATSGSGV